METFPTGTVLLNATDILKKAGIDIGITVGDFGCGGAGHFALPAARMIGERGTLFAVDILKSALSSVVSKVRLAGLTNVRAVWSNLEIYGATREIPNDSVDLGLIVNVLHQTQKADSVLKESTRMVKPGGKMLVIDWKTGRASFGPSEKDLILPDRVKALANSVGLTPLRTFDTGPYHYAILFVKSEPGVTGAP